ncbi:hypothetical protein J0B03_12125 [Alkalibacter rhizosphaerae]|uniref:Uncharacterized protein n=1 Tax=Alkalibacter rhizosphaerae TaxID=2815577 RepID=A0A975AHD7_9FIRM|nr:hypothetical protein [Alkalibacter rhizosphaerae]QSX08509.1 hypothetical protein J0B03_12125 [Alkalibacter rhizosphaerae]
MPGLVTLAGVYLIFRAVMRFHGRMVPHHVEAGNNREDARKMLKRNARIDLFWGSLLLIFSFTLFFIFN